MTYLPRLAVITPPAVEPVVYTEAKTHMRVTGTSEDAYITILCGVARRYLEEIQNRSYITQTLELTLDAFPDADYIRLPRAPLASVTSVKYTPDSTGVAVTLSSGEYYADTKSIPGQIVLRSDGEWPSDTLITVGGVVIQYVAGYGAASTSVPSTILHALKFLIAHWFENRESMGATISGAPLSALPVGLQSLIMIDRVVEFP